MLPESADVIYLNYSPGFDHADAGSIHMVKVIEQRMTRFLI